MPRRNARILRIVVKVKVHQNEKETDRLGFTLPVQAVDALGIDHDGWIAVFIRTIDQKSLYLGRKKMTSKCEVYARDMNIKLGQSLIVEISDPDR